MIIKSGLALDSNGLVIGANRLYTPNDQRIIARPYIDPSGLLRFRSRGEAGDVTNYKHFPYGTSGIAFGSLTELATQIGTELCTVTLRRTCLDPICGDPQNPDCCGGLRIVLDPPDVFGQTQLSCSNTLVYPKGTAISTIVAPEIEVCYPWTHFFNHAAVHKSCQLGTSRYYTNEFTFYTPQSGPCGPGDVCSAEIELVYRSSMESCIGLCSNYICPETTITIQGIGAAGFPSLEGAGEVCDGHVATISAARDAAASLSVQCIPNFQMGYCRWFGQLDYVPVGSNIVTIFSGQASMEVCWPCGPTGANRVLARFGTTAGFSLYYAGKGKGLETCFSYLWSACPGGAMCPSWGAGFGTNGLVDIGSATSEAQACTMGRASMSGTYSGHPPTDRTFLTFQVVA